MRADTHPGAPPADKNKAKPMAMAKRKGQVVGIPIPVAGQVIKTGKVYLAGEMKFTLQALTLSVRQEAIKCAIPEANQHLPTCQASVSLKLGIEIEGEINNKEHTVLLKGFFAAGQCCHVLDTMSTEPHNHTPAT